MYSDIYRLEYGVDIRRILVRFLALAKDFYLSIKYGHQQWSPHILLIAEDQGRFLGGKAAWV